MCRLLGPFPIFPMKTVSKSLQNAAKSMVTIFCYSGCNLLRDLNIQFETIMLKMWLKSKNTKYSKAPFPIFPMKSVSKSLQNAARSMVKIVWYRGYNLLRDLNIRFETILLKMWLKSQKIPNIRTNYTYSICLFSI